MTQPYSDSGKKLKHSSPKLRMVIAILSAVVAVIVLPTIALAYVGFVPYVSEAIQTNKPVDLGVTYSEHDYSTFLEKSLITPSNYDGDGTRSGARLVITPANTIGNTFSQQELTAALNSINWSNMPLKNAQVRFSEGIIELSGNVNSQYVADVIESIRDSNGSDADLGAILNFARYLHNPAVYVKAKLTVDPSTDENSGGLLRYQILDFKVNRFNLPDDIMSSITASGETTVKTVSFDRDGYDIRTLSIRDGAMDFYGTLPGSLRVGDGDPRVVCSEFHGGNITALDSIDGRVGATVSYCE